VWPPYAKPGEFPLDERASDGQCQSFTSAPLAEPMMVLGYPQVDLGLSADRPNALVAVRLCDVAPTGASTLVSWGLLNLTHRESHASPTSLTPGRRYQVTVQLNVIGYRIEAGHRWRVGISPTYWRHAWPSPESVTLSLFTGEGSRLRLPVRTLQPSDDRLPPFGSPETSAPLPVERLRTPSRQQVIERDIIGGWVRFKIHSDAGRLRYIQTGMETDATQISTYSICEGDPLSAEVSIQYKSEYQRGEWRVRVETDSKMSADAERFFVSNRLDAYEGNTRVFSKAWACAIPRDLV